jgi:DNA-binding NtrC family response regulator
MSSSVASPELSRTAVTARSRLYALDANLAVLDYLRRTLEPRYNLKGFSEEQALLDCLNSREAPDLILLEWESMEKSLTVLSHIRAGLPDVPIVMLSCTAEVKDFEVVTRIGARGIVLKPFMDGNLENAIEEHLVQAQKAIPAEPQEIPLDETHSFVRSSKRMCELQAQAALVAKSDIPVLILGESGTGKEILALYTHKMSNRAHRMFLKVNCAAMPADLVKTKPGKFEVCTGGTIFLDEIGEMPAILQAKLLQVLQDGTFSRLGSRSPMRVDVRVIAATNINMKEAIARKAFREDLYYRLNGFSLSIPPLCERREEIPLLASYFMRKVAKKYGRNPLPLSNQLLDAFSRYLWPGNLREMENVINRYFILGDERPILAEMNPYTPFRGEGGGFGDAADGGGLKQIVRSLKGEAEATAIAQMLENKGWNRKAAASELQISYKALLYKIKQYDLAPKRT